MGKKTKSDRINALRKEYDAFLEDDKKRKERNEFILCRLEKMRSSTSVVPIHHKENPHRGEHFMTQKRPLHLGYYDKVSRIDEQNIFNSGQAQMASLMTQELTGPTMLKEISKNFILIPKLQTTSEYHKTHYKVPSEINDNDWKSKYNILDELKKIEKGDFLDNKAESGNSKFDQRSSINNQQNNKENSIIHPNISDGEALKLNDLQIGEDYPNTSTGNDANTISQLFLEKNSARDNNKSCDDINNVKEHTSIYSLKGKDEVPEEDGPQGEVNNQNVEIETFDKLTNQENEKENCNQLQLTELNRKSQFSAENPNSNSNNGNLTMKSNEQNVPTNNEIQANMSSLIKNELYFKTDEVPTKQVENVPTQGVVSKDNVATDKPVVTNNPEQTEIPPTTTITDDIFTSQIEDFEAEQREMFCPNENVYDQSDVDSHDHSNQYFNDQYSYYNETHNDEQPYYTEVNEHEESTERYDPNYQQQYQNNYDKEIIGNQLYEVYGHNENYEQQLPVNYNYVSPENQQLTTNINYETQEDDNSSYDHQQDLAAHCIEESQKMNYEESENSEQNRIVNTSNIDNPRNENTKNEIEASSTLSIVKHPNDNVDITIQPELETIQTIERQLDKEDDYIEGEDHPETLKKVPEPEIVS